MHCNACTAADGNIADEATQMVATAIVKFDNAQILHLELRSATSP